MRRSCSRRTDPATNTNSGRSSSRSKASRSVSPRMRSRARRPTYPTRLSRHAAAVPVGVQPRPDVVRRRTCLITHLRLERARPPLHPGGRRSEIHQQARAATEALPAQGAHDEGEACFACGELDLAPTTSGGQLQLLLPASSSLRPCQRVKAAATQRTWSAFKRIS